MFINIQNLLLNQYMQWVIKFYAYDYNLTKIFT